MSIFTNKAPQVLETRAGLLAKGKVWFPMDTSQCTDSSITIQLTQGLVAIVDSRDCDLDLVKWHASKGHSETLYYARRGLWINRQIVKVWMHHVIMERILGRALVKGERVDHKDRNGLNNCRDNLRLATPTQNQANRVKNRNKSGLKGAYYDASARGTRKWRSVITVNKRRIHLGWFNTGEQAHLAYVAAAQLHFGEFANGGEDFPQQQPAPTQTGMFE